MLGEPENQFSLTRAALSTRGAQKQIPISLVSHRDEPDVKPFYERAFGKRPARELYDLRKDPYELKNVAEDPAYAATVKELDSRLMAELKATGDPRASGGGDQLDGYPVARPGGNGK